MAEVTIRCTVETAEAVLSDLERLEDVDPVSGEPYFDRRSRVHLIAAAVEKAKAKRRQARRRQEGTGG